jgi:hypothetical protein
MLLRLLFGSLKPVVAGRKISPLSFAPRGTYCR